ncbi:MAG: type II toxin-antitoxin system RelE/ParE family toxin [Deltaproteobacteria bacterium]|nr:type II toxin-antitoxin system RelE/ParE family toxin [Deltaproteobacteria bacterium]
MEYKIVLHRKAVDELQELKSPLRQKIKETIDHLAIEPRPNNAAKLKGRPNAYRIRFEDYRLIYEVHATEIVIYIIGIAHRREVYQRLLRRQ